MFGISQKTARLALQMKNYFLSILLLPVFCSPLLGQSAVDDFFRSTGKIYTVLGVVVILFFVLIIYLIKLDKKISKIEKDISNE